MIISIDIDPSGITEKIEREIISQTDKKMDDLRPTIEYIISSYMQTKLKTTVEHAMVSIINTQVKNIFAALNNKKKVEAIAMDLISKNFVDMND